MDMIKQQQFIEAFECGDLETVELLIDDPDVNPSTLGNDAIRLAARNGYKEIVELLMQDSRVDPSDVYNYAIRWAARNGHRDVVDLLLTDKRVMDNIDSTLKGCKEWGGGYDLLKTCVDKVRGKSASEPKSESESDGVGITLARIELVNGELTLKGEGKIEPQVLLEQMGFVEH